MILKKSAQCPAGGAHHNWCDYTIDELTGHRHLHKVCKKCERRLEVPCELCQDRKELAPVPRSEFRNYPVKKPGKQVYDIVELGILN